MCVSWCVCVRTCARVSTRQTTLKRFVSFLFQVMMSCPAHPKMQLGWRKWWNSSTTLSLKVRVWNNSPLLQQDASFYWNWTEHLIYMNNYAVIDVVLRLWVSNTLLLCWRVPFNYILISNFIIAVIHHFSVTFKRLSSSLLPTQGDFTFFLVFSFFPPFYMS